VTSLVEIEFIKVLSANDIGVTNSHQAGFLIPKRIARMNYFPSLDEFSPNPRARVNFLNLDINEILQCNYIYYNGRSLGFSTRSEFRLTGLTNFIKKMNFQIGDQVAFGRQSGHLILKKYEPVYSKKSAMHESITAQDEIIPFVSVNGWKIRER